SEQNLVGVVAHPEGVSPRARGLGQGLPLLRIPGREPARADEAARRVAIAQKDDVSLTRRAFCWLVRGAFCLLERGLEGLLKIGPATQSAGPHKLQGALHRGLVRNRGLLLEPA